MPCNYAIFIILAIFMTMWFYMTESYLEITMYAIDLV